MSIVPFQTEHRSSVQHIHMATFDAMNLVSFLTQPCTQIESLDKTCAKFVYHDEGIVKGYVAAYQLDPTHFRLNLLVDPQWTGRGIGTRLLQCIEEHIRIQGGKYLQLRILEHMESSLAFAISKGFREIHRMRSMSLYAHDFSYHRWGTLGNRLVADGFVATTYHAEMITNQTLLDQLVELHRCARVGWESPDPTWKSDEDEDAWRNQFSTIANPAHFAMMKYQDTLIAYTSVARENMSGTAVHPDYRGRSVATYLKAYNLVQCIGDGQTYFETSSANPAMICVNEKLGYRLNSLAEVRLLKYL